MPPRQSKSTCVSIMWPTWVWTREAFPGKPHNSVLEGPGTRWIFASYADELRTKHSLDRRKLLQSEWYRERWPKPAELTSDQNVKTLFSNSSSGVMLATTMSGAATGVGGSYIIVDDPHKTKKASISAEIQSQVRASDRGSGKAYRLLTDAMASSERVALGRYTMRGKEHLVLLRPYANGLMLHTLYYGDEVKVADEFDRSLNESVKETELTLARRLIDDLTQKKFDPSQYHDTYRERVIEAAQQKVAGEEVIAAPKPAERRQVIEMAALKASLEKRGAASRKSTADDAYEVEKKVATNAHPQRRTAVDTSVKARRTARKK